MTNKQMTLAEETKRLHHRNDPETSVAAAKKTVPKLGEQRQEVLDAIRKHYRTGDFTSKELAVAMARNQTRQYAQYYYFVSRRLNELADYIKRTGEIRNNCCVWRLKQ